jgi:eukaryotic-like serine/threonine-protein kinase
VVSFETMSRMAARALEPAKLAEFQIGGSLLGAGTTARVYEAVHTPSGRSVAIKVLEPSQAGGELRERFAREALLLSGVESRHVGAILGFGFDKGQPFLVLERLHGETLDAKLRRDGPVPVPSALQWTEQLLIGMRDCHDAKVIHRDVKPSNIFLHKDTFDEVVKLIDFGVARLREITGETGGLTSSSHLIGSMGYMAPEQFRNAKTVNFTADLYAVGVVIFRMLTGRLPFVSRSIDAVIRMKSEQQPPPVSSMPATPQNPLLDWYVQKAMAREPAARFQSAREMLEQWHAVMASFDDEGATEVGRVIGRVDESYAGPVPRPPSLHPASEKPSDRTVREVAPVTQPSPEGKGDPASLSEFAIEVESADLQGDPFDDLPTRSDPNLRKLVERELELQRKRKGRR